MYEAAIKTASTGVYFAVPYMAKLIIEFMEKNYQKENRNLRKSVSYTHLTLPTIA